MIGSPTRRILICIFDQVDENFANSGEVHKHARQTVGNSNVHRAVSQRVLAMFERVLHNILNREGLEIQLDFARVQSRHLAGFANQSIQPVAFLVDDREKLLPLALDEARIRKQIRHGRFDRSKWSAQRVRDSVEQSGSKLLALAGGFGLPELLDGARVLHRERDQRAHGFERLP